MDYLDPQLREYATKKQLLVLDTLAVCDSQREVAEKLDLNQRTIERHLSKLAKTAASRGYSPQHTMTKSVPDGFHVKGTSTLYNGNGEAVMQWVKSNRDRTEKTLEALREAVADIVEPVINAHTSCEHSKPCDSDLLCVYPIADAHIGMYAWKEESGEDNDTDIAIETIISTFSSLVDSSPSAETALIANLADFVHSDTQLNKTMRSGHQLDVDTRWPRVYSFAAKCYRGLVELALKKHKKVVVRSAIGNHDDQTIFSLTMLMDAIFKGDERVEVHLPYSPFAYHEFGNTLIGINHGDVKPDKLPLIMATDKRSAWGRTRFHHWLTGHIHHKTSHEFPGCYVETFRSPSAKDAWSARSGYRSERDMQQITIHAEYGEIQRQKIAIY